MSELWHEERMLIDGDLVAAVSGATYDNVNPATEEVIGRAADGGAADMDAAIGAAYHAAIVGGPVGDPGEEGQRRLRAFVLGQQRAQRLGAHQRAIAVEDEDRSIRRVAALKGRRTRRA